MPAPNSLLIITPQLNEAPATGFATLDKRNNHTVLDFDDTSAEDAIFPGVLPRNYDGAGLTLRLVWMATSAVAGDVRWLGAFERHDDEGLDLDGDSFAADQAAIATAPTTSGQVQYTDIAFTNAQIDGLQGGESFRLRIRRDAADLADDMVGDAELLRVEMNSEFTIGNGAPPDAHASTHISTGVDPIPNATQAQNGLLSPADKTKLDSLAAPVQASATGLTTTSSTTYVAVPGLSITPGAGDWLVFAGLRAVDDPGVDDSLFITVYANGVAVAESERNNEVRKARDGGGLETHALVTGLSAGQTIQLYWRTSAGGTLGAQARSITAFKVPS